MHRPLLSPAARAGRCAVTGERCLEGERLLLDERLNRSPQIFLAEIPLATADLKPTLCSPVELIPAAAAPAAPAAAPAPPPHG